MKNLECVSLGVGLCAGVPFNVLLAVLGDVRDGVIRGYIVRRVSARVIKGRVERLIVRGVARAALGDGGLAPRTPRRRTKGRTRAGVWLWPSLWSRLFAVEDLGGWVTVRRAESRARQNGHGRWSATR